ncbi:MAG TPA: hypothetical protein VD887_05015 [Allosphingosinicella sp.]|nr:hypothetical protein [Allosphingosinicella sp.]
MGDPKGLEVGSGHGPPKPVRQEESLIEFLNRIDLSDLDLERASDTGREAPLT